MKTVRRLVLAFILPALLPAQNTSCTLVRNRAGSRRARWCPDVKVTLTGEGNGFVRTVMTTGEGFFSFPDLTPATFTLVHRHRGIQELSRNRHR